MSQYKTRDIKISDIPTLHCHTIANGVLHCVNTWSWPRWSLPSKQYRVSQDMHKCNLIYPHKNTEAFPDSIFMKLTNTTQNLFRSFVLTSLKSGNKFVKYGYIHP